MRQVNLAAVDPGCVLGADLKIPSPHPQVLYKLRLDAGTTLTESHLRKLRELNVSRLPIKDPDTEDLDDYLYDEAVEEAEEDVRSSFRQLTTEFNRESVEPQTLSRLEDAISSLIDSLRDTDLMAAFTTLKTHDSYTAEHSLDVAKISLQLALKYEDYFKRTLRNESGASNGHIDDHMLEDLGLGAMLHDLGKQHVDEDILNKPAQLTDAEWETMTEHPSKGYEELKTLSYQLNAPVKVPAHQHHEKFDGSGYPRGLKGKEIHLFGRLTACADVYSALTSNRPYRDPQSPAEALAIMDDMQQEGPHFDPEIYEKFLSLVLPYPIGQEVVLSNGCSGVVADVDESRPEEPLVRVLEENGQRLNSPVEVRITRDSGTPRIVEPTSKTGDLVRA